MIPIHIDYKDMVSMTETIQSVFSSTGDNANSMTSFSKTTSVNARAYVEESVVNEDISMPLMSYLNQVYIGYVLTTLQLGSVLDNYSVVKKTLSRVSTEEFHGVSKDATNLITDMFRSKDNISTEAAVVDLTKSIGAAACSKLIEFDFIVPSEKGPTTVKVPVNVSINPAVITKATAEAFLHLNFETNMKSRWLKYQAGEISLFKDLLFSRDLTDKFSKALREDKTNVLRDMFDTKNKNRFRDLSRLTGTKKNNVASSILIFDKSTLDNSLSDSVVDFSRPTDRQKFFDSSLALICAVVDNNYKHIDIYFNGISNHSSHPFKHIEKLGGAKDGVDIKTLMATFAKGSAPRF